MPQVETGDIITMAPVANPAGSETSKAEEIMTVIQQRLGAVPAEWLSDGIECQYFSLANPSGWQTGRVRLVMEFIPTPPEPPVTAPAATAPTPRATP